MINREIAALIDEQFEMYRVILNRKRTFMLRKDYVHKEAFIIGSFKNLLDGFDLLHQTVKANYERRPQVKMSWYIEGSICYLLALAACALEVHYGNYGFATFLGGLSLWSLGLLLSAF